jgi:hypothetical protein
MIFFFVVVVDVYGDVSFRMKHEFPPSGKKIFSLTTVSFQFRSNTFPFQSFHVTLHRPPTLVSTPLAPYHGK